MNKPSGKIQGIKENGLEIFKGVTLFLKTEAFFCYSGYMM